SPELHWRCSSPTRSPAKRRRCGRPSSRSSSWRARYVPFAAGIAALVIMGLHRQWVWFEAMLLLVLVLTYGPDVLPTFPLPLSSNGQQYSVLEVLVARYIIYPTFVPLVLLFYRPHPSHAATAPWPAVDSSLDLEVTPLAPEESSQP